MIAAVGGIQTLFEVGDDGKVKRWREYFDMS
jgi:hypothetical protein